MDINHRLGMRVAFLTATTLAAASAIAETTHLPPIPVDGSQARDYQCQGGKSLGVAYYNVRGGQSFALLTVKNQRMLFVDTLAASGVKYVAGPYVWWTKGDNADLYDITAGPHAAPILAGCTSAPRT